MDWLSRPAADIPRVCRGQPVAIMSATTGPGGTALSQAAWLPVVRTLGVRLWFEGSVLISDAGRVFDSDGRVADAATRQRIRAFVEGLCGVRWASASIRSSFANCSHSVSRQSRLRDVSRCEGTNDDRHYRRHSPGYRHRTPLDRRPLARLGGPQGQYQSRDRRGDRPLRARRGGEARDAAAAALRTFH
jgi:hypothetical protein